MITRGRWLSGDWTARRRLPATGRAGRAFVAVVALAIGTGCASAPPPPVVTAPRFPAYPTPEVPAALGAPATVLERQDVAWRRFQAGDLGGASRDFSALLKDQPAFYPAEAGLGFVELADREFAAAASRFSAALQRNDRYLPAWIGQAEAQIALNNDRQAIVALERVLALDPKRDTARSRLELLRFREIQSLVGEGRQARQSGRLDEAARALGAALALSPSSPVILRELADVERQAGRLADAESYLRRSLAIDAGDAEAHRALAEVLEARGQHREAAAAYTRAASIDPRPEWRSAAAALAEKADLAALPPEFGDLSTTSAVTRAHVAAYIGLRLRSLVDAAPQRTAAVATDVGRHWAAPWILPVTRAGVMSVYPNHTFQPGATVRRGDLAQIAAELVELAAAGRPNDLDAWRAARPRFVDLPPTNVAYGAAGLVVAARVMAVEADGRFRPTEPATGSDLTRAVAEVREIAMRR